MHEDELLDIVPYDPNNQGSKLPDASTVLALGIVSLTTSIICCFFYGLPGLVTGIIGVVISSKGLKTYEDDPVAYSYRSYKDLKTGRTLSIIGICISGILLLALIILIAVGLSLDQDVFDRLL